MILGSLTTTHSSVIPGGPSAFVVSQKTDDRLRESLVDLTVARHGLRYSRGGVAIPVMLRAVPDQDAAKFADDPDQIGALHDTVSSARILIPGISPLVMSP